MALTSQETRATLPVREAKPIGYRGQVDFVGHVQVGQPGPNRRQRIAGFAIDVREVVGQRDLRLAAGVEVTMPLQALCGSRPSVQW